MAASRDTYIALARQAALKHGVDPDIFVRQINQESGFNPTARSGAGALGIAQFMPATAHGMGVDPYNVQSALNGAAQYDSNLLKQFGGDYRLALAGYNAGGGNARKALAGYGETQNYVASIMHGQNPVAASSTPAGGAPATLSTSTSPRFNAAQLGVLDGVFSDRPVLQSILARMHTTSTTASGGGTAAPAAPSGDVGASGMPTGVGRFGGSEVAAWIAPALEWAQQHGWGGHVTSGFRSLADQTRIYNSGRRPAAKPGTSNHEFTTYPGGAVDVSDAPALAKLLVGSPYAGRLVWAGGKDPVHFSHPHNGGY